MPFIKKIRTAIEDYGEFPEALQGPLNAALAQLESDLTDGGYEQSSKSDAAERALDDAMNEVDASGSEEEPEV